MVSSKPIAEVGMLSSARRRLVGNERLTTATCNRSMTVVYTTASIYSPSRLTEYAHCTLPKVADKWTKFFMADYCM
ncbi:hypothetical protein PSPO01_02129 [Paraphaeosphaeria sporulosa]